MLSDKMKTHHLGWTQLIPPPSMWTVNFRCWNDRNETQCLGYKFFESKPTEEDVAEIVDKLRSENKHAVKFKVSIDQK